MLDASYIGVYSEGTLRLEDIVIAVEFLAGESADLDVVIQAFWASKKGSEERAWCYEDICGELDDIAPEGCYWGGSEGDPACIGFWKAEDDESSESSDEA